MKLPTQKTLLKKLQNCTLLKLIKKVGSKIKVSLLGVVALWDDCTFHIYSDRFVSTKSQKINDMHYLLRIQQTRCGIGLLNIN